MKERKVWHLIIRGNCLEPQGWHWEVLGPEAKDQGAFHEDVTVIDILDYEELEQRWEATKDDRNLVDNANIKLNYEVIALRAALERCLEIFKYCQGPTRDVKTWKFKEGEELVNKVLNGEF